MRKATTLFTEKNTKRKSSVHTLKPDKKSLFSILKPYTTYRYN